MTLASAWLRKVCSDRLRRSSHTATAITNTKRSTADVLRTPIAPVAAWQWQWRLGR
jgi:hypothetical protein